MDELGACTAVNLDGGGSSAMWVDDRIVNRPSDLVERKVVNHLAVVAASDYRGCDD
jgi:exopolysaccharide biosynthesis protein